MINLVGSAGAVVAQSAGSYPVAFGQTPTPNNFLVLLVSQTGGSATNTNLTVAGTGWVQIGTGSPPSGAASNIIQCFVKPLAAGSSADLPTVSVSSWNDGWAQLFEFSGVGETLSPYYDQLGTATTPSYIDTYGVTAGGPDAAAGDLIIYGVSINGATTGTTFSGLTLTDSNGGNPTGTGFDAVTGITAFYTAYGITTETGTGADEAIVTASNNGDGAQLIATFKAAGGGGGGGTQPIISIAIDHP
jgi:hypothetical protein